MPPTTGARSRPVQATLDDISALLTRALTSSRGAGSAEALDVLRDIGVTGAPIAADYGGWGLDAGGLNVVLERLARLDGSIAIVMFQHFSVAARIAEWGTAEQRAAVLPRLASGEWLAASAWSETGAGAAKLRLATTARATSGGWTIDGAKTFVTGAAGAGILLVLATTSSDQGHDHGYGAAGQSFFLVPANTPHLMCQQGPELVGMRDSATGLISLQGCVVDHGALLGPLGEAPRIIASVRRHGVTLGTVAVGLAQRAYELAFEHVRRTGKFHDDSARHRLVAISTQLEAARALVALAGVHDSNQSGAITLHSKIFASETGEAIVAKCQHLLGSTGYMSHHPIDVIARDIRAVALMGPTNDLCRELLAEEDTSGRDGQSQAA